VIERRKGNVGPARSNRRASRGKDSRAVLRLPSLCCSQSATRS
jgi:hypothetical protein